MRPSAVVEVEVAAERSPRLGDAVVGLEVNVLVFDGTPEPLDKDIVPCTAPITITA
jgi:hypothetical protein